MAGRDSSSVLLPIQGGWVRIKVDGGNGILIVSSVPVEVVVQDDPLLAPPCSFCADAPNKPPADT